MKIIKQDLLKIQQGIIAHQCNCQGKMGAGLAKQIRRRYPVVYSKYKQACDRHLFTLGKIQLIKVNNALYVANLAGQDDYGNSCQYTDYDALSQCLAKLYAKSLELNLTPYLPYGIGCGLAGGNWETALLLIENHCPNAVVCRL